MKKILIFILMLCILPANYTFAQPDANPITPTITVTSLDVNDTNLKLSYRITNNSENDIWICKSIDSLRDFEVFIDEDHQTLLIRRRHNVPLSGFRDQPLGRYVRLWPGQSRFESLLLHLPVHLSAFFASGVKTQDTIYTKRVFLEIGYYIGDLPNMICNILDQAEKNGQEGGNDNLLSVRKCLQGFIYFNKLNESIRLSNKEEEVLISYTWQALKGEHVLQIKVNDLSIPYVGKPLYPGYEPPDLSSCTHAEIKYQPSMLEYFFPYKMQQDLLTPSEKKYLQSLNDIEIKETKHLKILSDEVSKGRNGGFVTEQSTANIICYQNGNHLMSFKVYSNESIETELKQRFRYFGGLTSLKIITPQIIPFEMRVQCAENLGDLRNRLELYHRIERIDTEYPPSDKWCDTLFQSIRSTGTLKEGALRPFKCPAAGEGKCHYGMNPNCEPSSPGDMVLLFETKAGWNQHGGTELFTFDNHNPKGGCVLLNDGTVKFIRTEEELNVLRWKQGGIE